MVGVQQVNPLPRHKYNKKNLCTRLQDNCQYGRTNVQETVINIFSCFTHGKFTVLQI